MCPQLRDCLDWIFERFAYNGVPYCVLRNYELLPVENIGADIDILIERSKKTTIEKILIQCAAAFRLTLLPVTRRSYVNTYRFYNISDSFFFTLVIDIHTDEEAYSCIYLSGEDILRRCVKFRNFFVPNLVDEAIVSWFSSYLSGGFIKKRYKNRIRAALESHPDEMSLRLGEIFGYNMASKLLHIANDFSLDDTLILRKKVMLQVLISSMRRKPLFQLKNTLRFLFSEFLLKVKPPGITVAIIGPDGSGKSTIAAKVMDYLQPLIHSDRNRIVHLRPGFLPPLRILLKPWKWRKKSGSTVMQPHGAIPSGFLLSLARLLYYLIDFSFGHYFTTHTLLTHGALVIYDRYYYDLIVDPSRARIKLPKWILKLFVRFLHKPDVTLYLDVIPDAVRKRKQELSRYELDRQVKAFRTLIQYLPNPCVLSNTNPIPQVVSEASKCILHTISARMAVNKIVPSKFLFNLAARAKYVSLPTRRNPRWIVPIDRVIAARAWDMYAPFSGRGRVYRNSMRVISGIGLLKFLQPEMCDSAFALESRALKACVEEVFRRNDLIPVMSVGTPGPYHKIAVLLFTPDGTLQGMAKIGEGSYAVARLNHEADVLRWLAESRDSVSNQNSIKVHSPRCLHKGIIGHSYILVQSPPPFVGEYGSKYFNIKYAELLAILIGHTILEQKLSESDFYVSLREDIKNYPLSYRDLLVEGLDCLRDAVGDSRITFALSHGDFAPWNMVWYGNEVFIFDWEASYMHMPIGIDVTHFLYQTGFLLKKYKNRKLMDFILDDPTYLLLKRLLRIEFLPSHLLVLSYLLRMAIDEDRQQIFSKSAVERRDLINLLIRNGCGR